MNDSTTPILARPDKNRGWLGLIIVIGWSALNIFAALFLIPKFEQIYQEALPGMPLPILTQFIISFRILLALIAFGWALAGIILLQWQKPFAILSINLGLIWNFLQTGVVTVALFMPMISMPVGMSDASPTNAPTASPPDNNSSR